MKKIHKIFSFLTVLEFVARNLSSIPVHAVPAVKTDFSQDIVEFYQQWKEKYVKQDIYITDEKQYYVWYSEDNYAGNNQSVEVTVSEAHGYGMLVFAQMADQDAAAKDYFDGMYRYYKAHPSSIGQHLMSWQQCDNGTALIDGAENGSMTGGFCDSATDGDMIYQNETARIYAEQISSFMKKASGSDPWEIMAGYHLNGTAFEI